MFVLTDLEPYTSYEVRLALTNRNGTADYSPWALNTTCDAGGRGHHVLKWVWSRNEDYCCLNSPG